MAEHSSSTLDRPAVADPKRENAGASRNGGGAKDPPKLGYRDFAWLAETLDGRRDEPLKITKLEENGVVSLVVRNAADALRQNESLVLEGIRIESLAQRPEVTNVTIVVGGRPIECRTDDGLMCDSVFCSESAMEKFVLPYYHSQRLLTDEEWITLTAEFRNPSTVAIGHAHPSRHKIFHPAMGSFYALTATADEEGAVTDLQWRRLI
jgi:hypothetical protein